MDVDARTRDAMRLAAALQEQLWSIYVRRLEGTTHLRIRTLQLAISKGGTP